MFLVNYASLVSIFVAQSRKPSLVGGIPTPLKKYESLEIMTFPTEWKVIFSIHIPNHQPAINIPLPEG